MARASAGTGDRPRGGGDPRRQAVKLLTLVTAGQKMLSEALPEVTKDLSPGDAARTGRLATETLRQIGRTDKLLGPFLRQRPPEPILNLLRLGIVELAQGGAAHGVVHAAVQLAKEDAETARLSGLVNAVLRKIAVQPPDFASMTPPQLPKPLRKRLVAAWGKETVAAMEAVFASAPPLDLTPRDGNAAALAEATGGAALPTGSVRIIGPVQVSTLPGYGTGGFWVQDAAAALPARVLAARPGETVLDLCAAPGGKTMQLAAAGADVTALDISGPRMQRVAENLARTGLSARCVTADALHFEGGPYDAILLDAPCSATGTLRRHPDLPRVRPEIDLAPLTALQTALADRAAALLRPGGRLVICTCSLLPEEGEAQAEALPGRHPDLRPDPAAIAALDLAPEWSPAPGQLRLRPDFWAERGGMDGFHIAAFRKAGA
ncbi:RsmB/NOP family class I SAM-dependent RNA methyltransferase [Frigidibacter sp. ROC022]|uniref:RsmB/NOP family class I SAM-dependent RNA methyltransferase n=1 Tax=Frigidibacter sp. ROC022 TaxID=2971796 RepID=UPI00215B3A34|nr:transcription antitermination factor NusB [Frigidibacter sp. ROC022]MCR8724887.1 methyltransferase domain-containing protein [Frigidibacter sp. ROC022]